MIIHKDCYGTIAIVWAICGALAFLFLRFIPWTAVSYTLTIIPMFFMGFVLFFFRVPQRQIAGEPNEVTSVADGRIVVIDKVFWLVSGIVKYYKYHPGKYMLAFLPKASELNEHTSTAISSPYGEVFFKQIAGTFARRIVCYAKEGAEETKGQECGIIKFGSRIDMYFPLDAEINVKMGDFVKASETVIATLKK